MSEQILDVPAEAPAAPVEQPAEAPAAPLLGDAPAPSLDIPEPFRVLNGEELDVTASAAKLAEAYKTRAAYGEIPAADAEYNPVEGLPTPWEQVKELDAVKAFTAEAKKLGFTHEQYAYALKTITEAERDGQLWQMEQNRQENEAKLRAEWAEPAEFDRQIKNAKNGLNLLPAEERQEFLGRYGNDASIIKLLAKIGGEIAEDSPVGLQANLTGEDIKTLMNSEAYLDSKHPEHAAAFAKVQAYYAKQYSQEIVI